MTGTSDEAPGRALIVEAESSTREVLRLHLRLVGFDLEETEDGRAALKRLQATAFDLLVLDLMLPGLDGISLCRAARAAGASRDASILMLTPRSDGSDKVLGLESGADDCMTKPFGIRELVARVGAITRRHVRYRTCQARVSQLRAGGVLLDLDRRRTEVRGRVVELTRQEFDVLHVLLANRGIVFSRQALLRKVWKGDLRVTERTVDTAVCRLRRKVEPDPEDPALILTEWGIGYRFADGQDGMPESSASAARSGAEWG